MDLKEIMTVPGKKGLYKLVSKGKNNVIVESLQDGSRMPVFVSMQASALDDIRIFTENEDLSLKDVFKRIYEIENGNKAIDVSSAKSSEIEAYMEKILPEYDKNRVYVSAMKKLFSWYNQLIEHNLLSFDEEKEEELSNETEEGVNDETREI